MRWCSCCCTSFRALLSGDLLFWRSFITFLAPSWTADSILKWCRNSSILSSRGDSTSHRWLAAIRGNRFNLLGHRLLKSWIVLSGLYTDAGVTLDMGLEPNHIQCQRLINVHFTCTVQKMLRAYLKYRAMCQHSINTINFEYQYILEYFIKELDGKINKSFVSDRIP